MRKMIISGVSILVLAVLVWAGGDPWKTKPYTQWDEKDVQAVLQTSPWAKANVSAAGAWHPDGTTAADSVQGTGSPAGGISGKSGSTSDGALPGQTGGTEKNMNAGPQVYSIFWWSSRTIRQAAARNAVLHGTATPEQAEQMLASEPEFYQVDVNGRNMYIFQKRGEDAFKDAAFIELKKPSKRKINPVSVVFQKDANGNVTGAVFNFPKKDASGEPTISSDEKEIDFNLRIADAWIRVAFNPKQMVDSKGQDL